ncbi:hypothetical protein B0H65DRAFT_540393 [Neurospora tetraspora]|uniref:Uncharacterized protein n=1 Tax=Neurospora tetraspora TaxID=94610 RepID=A0AAE0MQV9_9PEZI|nr:hypothetical protein B0H65DRAFT_540393 [Neurospora tetraspora]
MAVSLKTRLTVGCNLWGCLWGGVSFWEGGSRSNGKRYIDTSVIVFVVEAEDICVYNQFDFYILGKQIDGESLNEGLDPLHTTREFNNRQAWTGVQPSHEHPITMFRIQIWPRNITSESIGITNWKQSQKAL